MAERDPAKVLAEMRSNNEIRERLLASQGFRPHPDFALRVHIDALRAVLEGLGVEHDAYELAYQQRLTATFDDVDAEIRKAKLAEGTSAAAGPGLTLITPPRA